MPQPQKKLIVIRCEDVGLAGQEDVFALKENPINGTQEMKLIMEGNVCIVTLCVLGRQKAMLVF